MHAGVAGFVRAFVWFVNVRPRSRCVGSGSSCCALVVASLFLARPVRKCVPCGWLGSFGFVKFVRVRFGGRCVRLVSLIPTVAP